MSKDLLKVIAGLECCKDVKNANCDLCPYDDGRITSARCVSGLLSDALEILREVEQDGLY